MRDAGFLVFIAHGHESGACVKIGRMDLRAETQRAMAARPRFQGHHIEECTPHPASASVRQYCHAADVPVGQQPGATDGPACLIKRQQMHGAGVVSIPFKRFRDALLVDEHSAPDLRQARLLVRPIADLDMEIRHGPPAG